MDLSELLKKNDGQLKELAEFLPPEKTALAILILSESKEPRAKEAFSALFSGITSEEQLHAVGKLLGGKGVMTTIMALLKADTSQHWKISPLLVGISRQMFLEVLTSASPDHLKVLQHEALLEPLQHHLTLFVHEIDLALTKREEELANITLAIEQIDPRALAFQELEKLLLRIAELTRDIHGLFILTSRALSVAWNSGRSDLIERLGKAKEALIRFSEEFIGKRSPATGLWKKLQDRGEGVFGESDCDIEPGIEALGKLGLMSLHDFQEVGLLREEDLHEAREDERAWHEEKLAILNSELKALRLETVGAFREKHLFSKEMLKSYILYRKEKAASKT